MSYSNIDMNNSFLSFDEIIDTWNKNRKELVNNISDIWNSFSQSYYCDCRIVGDSSVSIICPGCNIISRFYKNGIIKLNDKITINRGKYKNSKYIITVYPNYKEFSLENYKQTSPKTYEIKGSLENYIYISCIIEYEMKKINLPFLPTFRWLWKCYSDVGIVSEYSKPFDKLNISKSVGRNIFIQLIVILHFLSNFNFSHGDVSLNSLSFTRENVTFSYDNVKFKSSILLHINPSPFSSISKNFSSLQQTVRIFNSGNDLHHFNLQTISSYKYKSLPFVGLKTTNLENTTVPSLNDYLNYKILGYKFNSSDIEYIRYKGLSLFNSLDVYLFLTSLICKETFYNYIINDEQFLNIWKYLFNPNEYPKLMNDIKELKNITVTNNILVELLSKYTLRYDAISYLWNSIKNVKM